MNPNFFGGWLQGLGVQRRVESRGDAGRFHRDANTSTVPQACFELDLKVFHVHAAGKLDLNRKKDE